MALDDVLSPALRERMEEASTHLTTEMAKVTARMMEQYLPSDLEGLTRDHVFTVIYEATASYLSALTQSACASTSPVTTAAYLVAAMANVFRSWSTYILKDGVKHPDRGGDGDGDRPG